VYYSSFNLLYNLKTVFWTTCG